MKLDAINIAIIKGLRNGRRPFKQIAESLDVSENTIRSRVGKLIDEGALDIVGLIDPEKIPHHRVVMIGVKLATMELVKKGEEISKLKGVVSVSVVTGRFDLMLMVLLKDGFGLLEFYTEEMSHIEDVQSVETFVVYKSYDLKVPYCI